MGYSGHSHWHGGQVAFSFSVPLIPLIIGHGRHRILGQSRFGHFGGGKIGQIGQIGHGGGIGHGFGRGHSQ